MKKMFSLSNLIFLVAILYAAYSMIPVMRNNFSQEGETIDPQDYQTINADGTIQTLRFPANDRSIAIFWATWCAPCKLEMARLKTSVVQGKIPLKAIVAINPFESPEAVRTFLKKESYPFTFLEDRGVSRVLNVNTTPTTLFLEKNKIVSLSSGLSFFGIWNAERFL